MAATSLRMVREALLVGRERAGPGRRRQGGHIADPDEVQGHAALLLGMAGIGGDELAHDRDNGCSSVNGSPTSWRHFRNVGTPGPPWRAFRRHYSDAPMLGGADRA